MSKLNLKLRRTPKAARHQRRLSDNRHVKNSPVIEKIPSLSRRESEVLSWVSRGKTNSDIGEILGISRRTVDTLLSRTYQKLGVENRTAAVMCLIEFIQTMQNLN